MDRGKNKDSEGLGYISGFASLSVSLQPAQRDEIHLYPQRSREVDSERKDSLVVKALT